MTHLSHHDLWGAGRNIVVTLPPSPGDMLVVTMLFGKRVMVHPIGEYERAVALANAFVRRARPPQPIVVKVLCVNLTEAKAIGAVPRGVLEDRRADADWQQVLINTCIEILRDCDDTTVRNDAYDLLARMRMVR